MASLTAPLPATWTVNDGLTAYLEENGFTRAAYEEPTTEASLLGVAFRIPNTAAHRWAIMRHDLHHVATGYGTDLAGEGEVSAWEAAAGLRGLGLYVGSIVGSLAALGMVLWPRRMLAARAASRGRSLFQELAPYDQIIGMSIFELRALLGVPERGLVGSRRLHARAPIHSTRRSRPSSRR